MANKVVLILTLDLFGGREVAHTVVLILTLDHSVGESTVF